MKILIRLLRKIVNCFDYDLVDCKNLYADISSEDKKVIEMFKESLNFDVKVPPHPQLMGAVGAALFGMGME